MDNIRYRFESTGYKIHLPVIGSVNDSLTNEIAKYLDERFKLSEYNRTNKNGEPLSSTLKKSGEYFTTMYKVGSGGNFEDGCGMTIYGRQRSFEEMQEIANDIEKRFGKQLKDNIKKYNIRMECPIKFGDVIQARFESNGFRANGKELLSTYSWGNRSGALTLTEFKNSKGYIIPINSYDFTSLSKIDKIFLEGESTMYSLEHFGELFTGRIKNGKIPQFVMDGLPKEYLEYYNITPQDLLKRINNGTRTVVANMLEDIAINGSRSRLFDNMSIPWFTTLEPEVINDAKQMLAHSNPKALVELEKVLPSLLKKYPKLSVLQKTVVSQSHIYPIVSEIASEWNGTISSVAQSKYANEIKCIANEWNTPLKTASSQTVPLLKTLKQQNSMMSMMNLKRPAASTFSSLIKTVSKLKI